MQQYLLVFIGGGLGTMLRHTVNVVFARWFGTDFPYYTLFENVTGSFLMGLVVGYFAYRGEASQHFRLFLATGILGGYTTFSAFSLDTAMFGERNAWALAALYVSISVVGSIAGLFIGLALMRRI